MKIINTMAYAAVAAVAAYNAYLAADVQLVNSDLTFENIAIAANPVEQTGGDVVNGVWTRVGSYTQYVNYGGLIIPNGYTRVYYQCQKIIPSSNFRGECFAGAEKVEENGTPMW